MFTHNVARHLVLLLCLTGCGEAIKTTARPIINEYQSVSNERYYALQAKLFYKSLNADYYSSYEGGAIAHGESFVLHDLVDRLEYANDVSVLPELERRINLVMERGLNPNQYDEVRRRYMRCWISTQYTNGKRYCWLLHTAKILEPILRYARIVGGNRALELTKQAELMMSEFDGEWFGSTYLEPYSQTFLPYNMGSNAAFTLWNLYKLTNKAEYIHKVYKIAQFQKAGLYFDSRGHTVWRYRLGGRMEDFDHGFEDVRLIEFLSREGIVFDQTDLNRVLTTYFERIITEDMKFSYYVSGAGELKNSVKKNCPRILHLVRYNEALFAVCESQ